MIERFHGDEGRRRLVEAISRHSVVRHDVRLAERLIEDGDLEAVVVGGVLIDQEGQGTDVFFIIAGEFHVFVNDRNVATRVAGQHVGEMSAIDPTEPRSARVVATNESVVLRVGEARLSAIGDDFPFMWRGMAVELGARLRARSRFHRPKNPRPRLFIGCSVEGLPVARGIQDGLHHDGVDAVVWTDGIFTASAVTVNRLIEEVGRADFAVLVLSPDDHVETRGSGHDAPRDNVVFELGLFMGRLGRERVFGVVPQGVDVKVPTDLLGVACPTYDASRVADNAIAAAATATNAIRDAISRLGSL